MGSYSQYDDFAWVYDRHWGTYANKAIKILETLLLAKLPQGSRILDLCCGTGQLTQLLTHRQYQVTGVDLSTEMLKYARLNAPTVNFIKADARDFALAQVFDGVISIYDSLNHILDLDELVEVFCNVHSVLKKGGLFVFDLNTEEGYLYHWQDCSFHIVEDDHACIVQSRYDENDRLAIFNTTMFRKINGWQRTDITILQRCYSEVQVRDCLDSVGFNDIEVLGYNDELGAGQYTEQSERMYFICRRSM